MNRDYDGGKSQTVTLFVGTEIEKTPAYGMKTLFVVGVHDDHTKLLELAAEHGCKHIYLGANQSFKPNQKYDESWDGWDKMVTRLLESNILVTLDFDSTLTETVIECCWTEKNNFIPMVSVKLAYLPLLGYNACLKLDDKDFNSSNPGVWVHHVHDLMSRDKFTDWRQYEQDVIIETTDKS